jgi:serine protease AprX
MAEITILFRLRFAVALTIALTLLLFFQAREAMASPHGAHEYIVQMDRGVSAVKGQRMAVKAGGVLTGPQLRIINGFAATMSERAAKRFAKRAGVKAVSRNARTNRHRAGAASSGYARCNPTDATTAVTSLGRGSTWDVNPLNSLSSLAQPMIFATDADNAWRRATGRGVGVAVLDTGISGDHPDFWTGGDSRVIASAVTNPCARNANDQVGHGTHVAGLIAGNSLNHPNLRRYAGRYMGVAPRANLVSVKVSDDDGDTTVLDVIYGLQFAIEHKDELGIRVINLSLSSTNAESYRTDPLDAAVEVAWFSGIVVVAAAGNEGTSGDAVDYAPGNDPYVVTVGAFDDKGTRDNWDDEVAGWSSRGWTQDGVRKPEVLAPGKGLVAALAPNSDFEDLCGSCVVNERYFRLSGTSMSTGVVSGVVALMLEENPWMSPNQVKGALMSTLRNVRGTGAAVDADAAMDARSSANGGLTPSRYINPATGDLADWARASFRRASFRDAYGSPLGADWTRVSFRCDCGYDASGEVDPQRVSFRRVSFRRTVDFGG